MAHNINTYIGRQSAWHKLGLVTGKYMTWQELASNDGLNYSVVKNQLEFQGQSIEAWGTFRSDNGVFLGTVGEGYEPIQHATGFQMIDALVASTDGAHYETAGVLGKGEKVWGMADLALAARVGDDVQNGYLLFSTGHDGSMSYSYRLAITRVVCNNTLTAALSEKTKASFSIRHTKSAHGRIIDAHKVLDNMGADVKRVEDKLNFLAQRKMNREGLVSVMDRLFPKSKTETPDSDVLVSSTRRDNILADILKIYELNDGNAFPEQRGTAYNLLNAVTNYSDHERGTDKNRAESSLFGSGDNLKSKAFELLVETAGTLPQTSTPMRFFNAPTSTGSSFLDDVVAASIR